LAERLGARGAEVLDVRDRLVVDLERDRERQARELTHRAEPVGVDVVRLHAGRLVGLIGGVDQEIVGAFVPMLAELRAAHADDRDPILDAIACHDVLLCVPVGG
jgi:hypothetical protein